MTVRIFISGPIRPTEESVRRVILSIRSAFPDAITYLFTWKSEKDTAVLQTEVDHYLEEEEPDAQTIMNSFKNVPYFVNGSLWPAHCYKMMYGVNKLCEYANPDEEDVIVRIRTDSMIYFKTQTIVREILDGSKFGYLAWFSSSSGRDVFFNDWFACAQYKYFKYGWRVSSIEDFDQMFAFKYNPEHVVKTNLLKAGVRIYPIDMRYVTSYILREKDGVIIEEYH